MNIVLIGMPACGKSTIGVILAKTLGYSFIDTDLIIQSTEKTLLCHIIAQKGNNEFIKIEENTLLSLNCDKSVIATGGSAVYGERGMLHLRENSCIVYLCASLAIVTKRLTNIKTRGVVIPEGMSLEQMYTQRGALYEKYTDVKINTDNLSIEECVGAIKTEYEKFCACNMKG